MKFILYIFLTLIIFTYSVLPTWNVQTSAIDLLNGRSNYSYIIDKRNWFYKSSDILEKTIKKINGKITHENTFVLCGLNFVNVKFQNNVQFEAIESFYGDTNGNTDVPLVCPKGNFNPFKVTSTTTIEELVNNDSNWKKNEKFELKCYYHRSNNGHFLVYYLMNGNNYLLELKSSNLQNIEKYSFDVDEIYDFKLLNKESNLESESYPFMALVKKDDNLRLIGAKLNFFSSSQTIDRYKDLLKIKQHTQAYFHVYHYNNDFYYFTYNDISDFSSGYSTKSITTTSQTPYDQINDVTFENNNISPFEFMDEVEIIQMENIFNYKYVYYTILNKITNVTYHGLYDIKLNRIMFNTDVEVDLFIPYITFIDENGGYQHSNSMLMITKDSAYRICAIKNSNGDDCVEECPTGQKTIFDVDGNKCVDINKNCDSGKINLIPEDICISLSKCDSSIFISNGTHCGLCRDMDDNKKYKFINGTECLSEIPLEGAKIYNENLSLLVCDSGYILKENTCIIHCFNTCKTCFEYSENENEQKCKTCIEGYYIVNNIANNCEPIPPTTLQIPISTSIITSALTTYLANIITSAPTTYDYDPTTSIITTEQATMTHIPITTNNYIPTTNIITTEKAMIIPIQTTIPKISTTIIERNYNICTYQYYLTYNCSFNNLTNLEILNKLKVEMLKTYPQNGINVEINALKGNSFQLSNSISQLASNDSSFSKIDLGECENKIKETNGLDPNTSLIFLKFENIGSSRSERNIQYEVYEPFNYEPLNLSICENKKIKIITPFEISHELIKIINNILDQGYDPFNENGKFYREICTPYNSENGTDVLLDDREEYIYSTIKSEMACPNGCEMTSYSLDTKYKSCECNINSSGIVEFDLHHISAKNIKSSVLTALKNSNYKVMKCYNLVFNFKIFCHNYGSIITLIFFLIYIGFLIYYIYKGILPLKINISKLLFEDKNEDNNISYFLDPYILQTKNKIKSENNKKARNKKKKGKSKRIKESFPPRKEGNITRKSRNNYLEEKIFQIV